MPHSKTLMTSLALLVLLSGCASYRTALEQQLEGKAPEEKRAILAQECASEIANGLKNKYPSDKRHVEFMKNICEEMTGQKVEVALPKNNDR